MLHMKWAPPGMDLEERTFDINLVQPSDEIPILKFTQGISVISLYVGSVSMLQRLVLWWLAGRQAGNTSETLEGLNNLFIVPNMGSWEEWIEGVETDETDQPEGKDGPEV